MEKILNFNFLGNSTYNYIIFLIIFVGGLFILFLLKKIVLKRLKNWAAKTTTQFDDLLIRELNKNALPILIFLIFYFSIQLLNLSKDFVEGLNITTKVVLTFFVVRFLLSLVNYFIQTYLKRFDDYEQRQKQFKGINILLNLLIWVGALIFLLDNLGVKVSAVVAGLGIGGIAVALAAQTILGDLFSYFVIFFDRPFSVGDFIIVADKLGVVEYIGIKTTRIRALSGEQIVFSNTDLTNSRIHNFKKMERRRVVFQLGVVYETPFDKLKLIPDLVKQLIEQQPDVTFDRGHFAKYGDSSLNFEFVYYVNSNDYNKYMDIQQAINYSIFEAFEKEGIEFAYPTQTLYVSKTN